MKKIITMCFVTLFVTVSCIAQKHVDAKEIINKIDNNENVSYKNAVITGDLDLTLIKNMEIKRRRDNNNHVNSTVYLCSIESSINFTDCTFKGKIIGYLPNDECRKRNNIPRRNGKNDCIYSVDFEKDAIFKNCVFEEFINLKYTVFYEDSNFEGARFKEDVFFKYTEFSNKANFKNAKFEEEAFFKYTEFIEGVDFTDASFDGTAIFRYAKFPEGGDFLNASFEREADFKYTNLKYGINFKDATFYRLANFKYAKFHSPLNLSEVNFEGNTDFKYATVDGRDFTTYLLKKIK